MHCGPSPVVRLRVQASHTLPHPKHCSGNLNVQYLPCPEVAPCFGSQLGGTGVTLCVPACISGKSPPSSAEPQSLQLKHLQWTVGVTAQVPPDVICCVVFQVGEGRAAEGVGGIHRHAIMGCTTHVHPIGTVPHARRHCDIAILECEGEDLFSSTSSIIKRPPQARC
jgi:hypothetical protein